MNQPTHDLIERPYGEVVDDLLTAVVGGVVNEPVLYDERSARYPLAEPARQIRAVTGTARAKHYQFQKEVDFTFDEASNALVWLDAADRKPDDDTLIYIDYYRRFSQSPLTDINVGSVTRTLLESIARETALVYKTINQAYLMGFIDTATGRSLDHVVAILGVVRKTKEYAEGLVTFFRDAGAGDGNITIPEGVLMTTEKREANFVSTQMRTLQRGQARIDVPVRATDGSKGPAGIVADGLINTLLLPIAGIARISNFDGTILGETDETDDELRTRTKAVLRSAGKGTLAAIRRVIAEERTGLLEVWDPNGPKGKRATDGQLRLLVDVEPGRFESVRAAVEETRAAGVHVELLAKYVFIRPRVEVWLTPGLTAAGKLKAIRLIIGALQKYTESLKAGESATGPKLYEAITSVPDVINTRTVKPIIKDVIVQHADLQADGSAPSLARKAQRSLIVAKSKAPVTAAELQSGDFEISAAVDNSNQWTIVLDMEAADFSVNE